MIRLNSLISDPTYFEWKKVNDIIWPQLKDTEEWRRGGFEGLNSITPDLFGFSVIRNAKSNVEFIFDEDQDYVYFKLRWF